MFYLLLISIVIAQYGQDDKNYTDYYSPTTTTVTTTTSSSETVSNLQKYIPDDQAKQCVTTNCNEELVACQHNDQCLERYKRFDYCWNITRAFKNCKEQFENTTLFEYSFYVNDLFECYDLCGWSELKGLIEWVLMGAIQLYLLY